MHTLRKLVDLFLFTVAVSLMVISPAPAAVSCHKINAKGIGEDLGGGNTRARIIGGGLLHGTTQASFAVTGGSPPALSVAGAVTFTTRKGTLTATVTGTFDVANGSFMTSGPITGATGRLAHATGTLALEGLQDLTTGMFVEDVRGLVCVDLAP